MPININLTPQLEDVIRRKVSSGSYYSASEVVREALRLMEHEDRIRAIQLERLRQDIQEGLGSGPTTRFDADELKQAARKNRNLLDVKDTKREGRTARTKISK